MAANDLKSLREYVASAPARQVQDGTVLLDVVHNLLQRNFVEIPFELELSLGQMKEKIHKLTGSRVEHLSLTLDGRLMSDGKKLGFYQPKNRSVLKVQDADPHSQLKGGAFDNVDLVKKFELTNEEYEKRDNTYRAYKKKMKAENPDWVPVHVQRKQEKIAEDKDEPAATTRSRVKVGMRCQVSPGARRGQVMHVGEVPELPSRRKIIETEKKEKEAITTDSDFGKLKDIKNIPNLKVDAQKPKTDEIQLKLDESKQALDAELWIGVKFDDPVGKGDGTAKSKRYFKAEPKFGGFLNPIHVEVGDFPEKDILDEDEDEEL